ncbi:MAG TPA: DUF1648 domain-containing protein [Candidatus Sulfotelmatobacter sp.]|nr:DUF1648 domain-containing protein [Candidatus Sulfotelmatobacter sp.]
MARNWHKLLILLMWLALPVSAWMYWSAWDRLPVRMAVHFDAAWQPNGYTSRDAAAQLGLEILLVMLVLFTVAMLIIHTLKPAAFWPVLVIACFVVAVCTYANYSIVKFNLHGQQISSESVGGPGKSSSQFSVNLVTRRGFGDGTVPAVALNVPTNTALAAPIKRASSGRNLRTDN